MARTAESTGATPPRSPRTGTPAGGGAKGATAAAEGELGIAPGSETAGELTAAETDIGTATCSGTEATMRISDAAERLGVSARTLRFYEELQLVSPSGHTAGGARRYAPEDLVRIERIQELKEMLGLGLDEIKEVLETESRIEELRAAYHENAGVCTEAADSERRAILLEALERRTSITEQLDRKMARMAAFRAKLVADASRTREILAQLDR